MINELMANPDTGRPDWIELYNTTGQTINLGGWFLSDDADELTKCEIDHDVTIAAGGYIVFTQGQDFSFGLSSNGETVYLSSGQDGVVTGYSEQERFDASETGVSLGRYRKSTGAYNFVAMATSTPGAANSSDKIQLSKPGDEDDDGTRHWIRVDRVVYSDGSHGDDFAGGIDPWPIGADGQGLSLTRIDPKPTATTRSTGGPPHRPPVRPNDVATQMRSLLCKQHR